MSATLTTAQLGPACLPQPDLLPRGRQGRPLRRLGAAPALHRAPGGVPVPALAGVRGTGVGHNLPQEAPHPFTDAVVEADSY
jgi:hypothetical protein